MIPKKELRTGNYVVIGKKVRQVEGWMYIQENENMSPIPLTPEILIACGFREDQDGVLELEWPESTFKFYWVDFIQVAKGYAPIFNCRHITSLHQLQNLYFALTGEELNYKPLTPTGK